MKSHLLLPFLTRPIGCKTSTHRDPKKDKRKRKYHWGMDAKNTYLNVHDAPIKRRAKVMLKGQRNQCNVNGFESHPMVNSSATYFLHHKRVIYNTPPYWFLQQGCNNINQGLCFFAANTSDTNLLLFFFSYCD